MDQLFAKFNNLGYELLGIFVPGAILMLILLFWWWCLGPLAVSMFAGYVPQAELRQISDLLGILNEQVRLGMAMGLAVAAYFSGHLLHWLSRKGEAIDDISGLKRIALSLKFSIPRPIGSFHEKLEPLFDEIKPFFGFSNACEWRHFYPVAKAYLLENLQTSLVATYQNKYTLHRSITAAAAIWFWLSIGTMIFAGVASAFHAVSHPNWLPLSASPAVAAILVWGFSGSYRYNWQLFGDTIITEVYMLKRKPK